MILLDKANESFKLDIVSGEIWQCAFLWLFSHESPAECHRRLNVTLITLSLMGMSGLDGQPRLEYLKCLICVSSEEAGDPCSSSLSFRVLSLEAACSCPRLLTAGGVHAGRRGAKPSVWTAGSHSELLYTFMYTLPGESFKIGLQQIFIIDSSLLLCFYNDDILKWLVLFDVSQGYSIYNDRKLKSNILTFEQLELVNIWHFCLLNCLHKKRFLKISGCCCTMT